MTLELTDPHPVDRADEILTPAALEFVEKLHGFAGRRDELLAARRIRRAEAAREAQLDFLPDTRHIRESEWQVADAPPAMQDRRVEMTGPATPRRWPSTLSTRARRYGWPTWRTPAVPSGATSSMPCSTFGTPRAAACPPKSTAGNTLLRTDAPLAVVVTRPRGWHLDEAHVLVDGKRGVGALVDFGLHFFHLAQQLIDNRQGPYYYLPKMESHLEARLWNDIFTFSEAELNIPHGTIRATMLIETIPAAFEMEEILYELREYASGLNAGRWDYLFSIIKYFRDAGPEFVMVDRSDITMTAPFMRAYTELLVKTCHTRGAFAMGGMAAFIPSRKDPEVNAAAIAKVRADKLREARDGFDGSWVAHPDLVPVCREVFDEVLGDRPNQLDRKREDVSVTADQLLDISSAEGSNTMAGLRDNLYVAVAYTAVWLSGNGAVAIHNLMEDAATAEISRAQVWQLIKNGTMLADTGEKVTKRSGRADP